MKTQKGTDTGDIMNPEDNNQYSDEGVLENVTERLEKLGGNPIPVVKSSKKAVVNNDNDDDPTSEDDELEGNEDDLEDGDTNGMEGDDDSDIKDGDIQGNDEAPVIPEKLERAATHAGWKSEQLVKFWKNDPELAKSTLEKMHEDMVSVNNQYAEQGRTIKKLDQQKLELNQPAPQPQPKRKDFVDIQQAEEEFGPGAAAIIKQLNDALVSVTSAQQEQVPVVQNARQKTDLAEQEKSLAILQQMGGWFADPGLKPYEDYYGTGRDANGLMMITTNHLTNEQQKRRNDVLKMASDIEAGVNFNGGSISVHDALTRAHIILTKDMQVQAVRKEILDKQKKRSKGVTLRPNGTKIQPKVKLKPGEKMTEKQVVANATKRLAVLQSGKELS